jgi:hypothetical protein
MALGVAWGSGESGSDELLDSGDGVDLPLGLGEGDGGGAKRGDSGWEKRVLGELGDVFSFGDSCSPAGRGLGDETAVILGDAASLGDGGGRGEGHGRGEAGGRGATCIGDMGRRGDRGGGDLRLLASVFATCTGAGGALVRRPIGLPSGAFLGAMGAVADVVVAVLVMAAPALLLGSGPLLVWSARLDGSVRRATPRLAEAAVGRKTGGGLMRSTLSSASSAGSVLFWASRSFCWV